MLPYSTAGEAEAALGPAMTGAEAFWFSYSASVPDHLLYCHNVAILLLVYTFAPLPLALLELCARAAPEGAAAVLLQPSYKLQPRARLSPAEFLRCYLDTARVLLITGGMLSIVSFPVFKVSFTSHNFLGMHILRRFYSACTVLYELTFTGRRSCH